MVDFCFKFEAAGVLSKEASLGAEGGESNRSDFGDLGWLNLSDMFLYPGEVPAYVLSVLKFTYPTLFQGWQTFIGGLLLHVSWKLGWVEINSSSRSDVFTWLPASVLFVGVIYAGSRALSRLAVPVFLTLHNVAEVIIFGYQRCFRKEKTSPAKICSALFLLAAGGCLPFNDSQFDPDGYFWAVIHLFCLGAYRILQKSQKHSTLSDIDQQYLNYISSVVLLAFASHPTGDLFSVLDFPFLYFYRFHGSCCASGFLGFFLMLSTVKLKILLAPGQCAAWIFFAKVITAGLSILLFDVILTSATVGCLLLGGFGEALLIFSEQNGS
ncbi:PREDICTED: transmembrane protein 241 [Galeopterus variegatus]|uniref:Transmembrane protein 241 n=1 Tax=Galeopterus variegatus TaxID=482537 RepID=A0ABM0QE38_GALVR|nr:PREDICTED: transmembrane protein 241 [Galeopterus variegatus]